MSNGENLLGHESSTQSAIIVPNIDNPNLFYIFTAEISQAYFNDGVGNGFNYSVVDMSLNLGLGGVILKNTNLLAQSSEKVSAVSAFDGSGSWVVTHSGNRFYANKVDGNGVNHVPVVSIIGPNISDYKNLRESLKISPNAKKLAVAHAFIEPYDGYVYLYDFNPNTGVVSNEVLVGSGRVFYGLEFSSKSTKLYASGKIIKTAGGSNFTTIIGLFQYDLESINIESSEFLVHY